MQRSSLAMQVITSSYAWRPEQHLGQAHGSVQLVLVLCKHYTLGGLAGTILLALPHPPSPQCCHSSSSNWERPSCKRTREFSSPWHPPASWRAASHREADRRRCSLLSPAARTTACWRGHQHSERAPSGWALGMFPSLQLQSHKSPKLLCCRAAIKRAAHFDSSSSAVLSHKAAERPLSLVLFRSSPIDVQDVPIEARPPIDDIAKTDEFTRHGRSWALCDSSQLRPSSSLEQQLITFDQRANESQEA